jgi:hypothetical protein
MFAMSEGQSATVHVFSDWKPSCKSCKCDYCRGVKRWEDWCARCGQVRLRVDQHWENLDVCHACDAVLAHEYGQTEHDPGDEEQR